MVIVLIYNQVFILCLCYILVLFDTIYLSETLVGFLGEKMIEEKQLQTKLSEQVFQSRYIATMIIDKNHKIDMINPYCLELFGYSAEEMMYQDISIIHISETSRIKFADLISDDISKQGKVSTVYPFMHKDGSIIWLKVFGESLGDGTYLWTAIDITHEKLLEFQNIKQAQIIHQIQDSIILINFDGIVKSWNNGAKNLFGYTQDEVQGKHISEVFKENQKFTTYFHKFLSDKINNFEIELKDKYEQEIFADLTFTILKDSSKHDIGVICYLHDITDRKNIELTLEEQKNQLDYYANHDVLTSLPNRMYFQKYLDILIGESKISDKRLALFFLDLDRFKQINDSLGHKVGDSVLIEVAQRLKNNLSSDDIVARLGGDEFTIIIKDVKNDIDISNLANQLISVLSQPICVNEHMLYISCSIGISIYPDDASNHQDLLKYADAAMYRAKEEGRNNYQFYQNEMTESAFEKVIMEAHLREALQNDDFVVYYQPQIDTKTEELVGMEALVRWEHKTLGIVPPSKFISLAEATGLIVDLDRFVMRSAIRQFALWYKDGYNPGKLSLNLTVQQIHQTDFIVELKQMIKDADFKLEWLTLEVTESQIMKHPDETIKILEQISSMGISLAIDDFGVAYSSLSQLKKLPLDILKIDQSFIRGLPDNEQDISIAKAIIALANSLDFKVLAEGVEDKPQRDFLLQEGCGVIQGYYYSRPITADEIKDKFLKESV